MREERGRKGVDDQRKKNKALIRRYFSAYDKGDIDAVFRLGQLSSAAF